MDLELSERAVDGCAVVELRGELDLSSAPGLRERLLAILTEQSVSLIIDLSGLQFMDSTGLTVLLSTERRAKLLGGALVLAAPQKIVAKVLRVTGLDTHFTIFPTVAEAARAVRQDCPRGPSAPGGPAGPTGPAEPAVP
ncbi:MAG TPA: STAS domain-containing protein [Streptosporangiaceae bacterium]|nr:STAS domain-containing protein [Streptosporangiaceae bacterium]